MKKMKKIAICLLVACLSLAFIPLQAKETTKPASATEAPKPAEVTVLELRISEINSMDKSKLSTSEKKELRKEVKEINKKAKSYHHDGILYMSTGAVILIIILIFVLL